MNSRRFVNNTITTDIIKISLSYHVSYYTFDYTAIVVSGKVWYP